MAHGLEIAGDFTQSGDGYAEIEGGGTYSNGVNVIGDFTQSGNGTIRITSGNNWGAEGLIAGGVVRQTGGGTIYAEGLQAAGIATTDFYMSGTGTVIAKGGHSVTMSNTPDPITGLYDLLSIGVGISADTFNISSGTLTATGGYANAAQSATYAGWNLGFAGIESTTFNQSGGEIVAYGGQGTLYSAATIADSVNNFSAGIYTGNYNHIGGTLTAYAGTEEGISSINAAQNAHGIVVLNDFTMSGTANQGQVTVYGAERDGEESSSTAKVNSVGMWVGGDFYQTATQSRFKAVGGNATNTYGLYVAGTAEINGTFAYENTGSSAAVYVANSNLSSTTVTIKKDAVISPVIDLRSTAVSSGNDATGLLLSDGVITIESGATLKPMFKNSASLGLNETSESKVFMKSNTLTDPITGTTITSAINGYFAGTDPSTGIATGVINLMFEYSAKKSAALDEYEITITRVNTVDNALQGYVGENTMSLLQGLTNGLVGTYFDEEELVGTLAALNDFYTQLEPLDTLEEMAAIATEAQKYLTNHGTTRMATYAIQQLDVVESMLNSEMTFAQKMPYWQVWAKGVYNYSDNVKAKTEEFVKGKDEFSGFVLGAARDFRYVTFGGQFHYLTGKVKSKNIYQADPDTFGIIVGARVHDIVNPKGTFNPWFDINFAYSRMDADQHRTDLLGERATSTVKSDIMRVSAAIGNTFKLGDMVTLTPQVGMDYTHISQKGYTERHSELALDVDKASFDSFRPKVGAELDVAISDVISAQLRGYYRYEAGDNRMILENRFAGADFIYFKTKGEKLSRSSGQLGVGFDVNFTETVSLGLDYDLWLRDHYTGHQFGVELRVNF